MEVYTSENDQVEALKKFMRTNGTTLIGGLLIGLALVFGWRAWQDSRHAEVEAASIEYTGMLDSLIQGKKPAAQEHGGRLLGQYAGTPYAPLAALAMAKMKLEEGDSNAARTHLKWAIENAGSADIKNLARLRLARVLLDGGDADQALKTLDEISDGATQSTVQEVKGDTFFKLGQTDKAREAYSAALAALGKDNSPRSAILQMKLDEVGGTAAPEKAQ